MGAEAGTCPKCTAALPAGALECPRCGVILARARAPRERPLETVLVAPEEPAPRRERNWPLPVALAAVLVVAAAWKLKPERLPEDVEVAALREGQVDPCAGRARCLMVVLAPWCPACKQALPLVRTFATRFAETPDLGFKVVVSGDTPEKVRAMAESLGGDVAAYLDPQARTMAAMGARGVPHWFVVDEDQRVLARYAGFWSTPEGQLEKLGLAGR